MPLMNGTGSMGPPPPPYKPASGKVDNKTSGGAKTWGNTDQKPEALGSKNSTSSKCGER